MHDFAKRRMMFSSALGILVPQRFGELSVQATIKSTQTLMCISPPHPSLWASGSVPTRYATVNLIIQESRLQGSVSFRYVEDILIFHLQPQSGPYGGGTVVVVSGIGFMQSSSLYCRFETSIQTAFTVARIRGATRLECITPLLDSASDARMSVNSAQNVHGDETSVDVKMSSLSLPFAFHADAHVRWLRPPLGPPSGGTQIRLACTSDLRLSTQHTAACSFNYTMVPARQMLAQILTCSSPPMPNGLVTVEISFNMVDSTNDG